MLDSVGLLFRTFDDDRCEFLGTCFAYRSSSRFITAAHCLEGVPCENLKIMPFHNHILHNVHDYEIHPEADFAIIRMDMFLAVHEFNPFVDCLAVNGLGMDFAAFGFPEDSMGPNKGQSTPRLFKGHIQSVMHYHSSSFPQYKYEASELNIACPRGLSGGPIFSVYEPQKVIGVVTENLEASTIIFEEEKHSSGEHVYYQKYVEYGVAVLLDPIKDWLNEKIPNA